MNAVNSLLFGLLLTPLLMVAHTVAQVNFYDSHWQEIPAGDCLMILGSKVLQGNLPDVMMVERANAAFPLVTPDLKEVILTGGTVDDKKPEAEVLQKILSKKGIDKAKMLLEDKSTSTYQNLLYSREVISKAGCEKLDILSHDFHLHRVKITAERLGIPVNRYIAAKSSKPNGKNRLYREYAAYLWYWLGWKWLEE